MQAHIAPFEDNISIFDNALRDNHTFSRANTTSTWSYGLDREQAYRENSRRSKNKKIKTYKPEDFDYKYNSLGIRCDEFDSGNLDILYSGCSFTEGEGLPKEHIWAYQLNELIKKDFNVDFGYHNIGRGGLSGSGMARKIYHAIEVLGVRPKMVIALFPSIFRTEFYLDNFPAKNWFSPFDFVPSYTPKDMPKEQRHYIECHENNMRLINSLNEFYKNNIMIEAICAKYGIEYRFSTWQGAIFINDLSSQDYTHLPKKYLFSGKGKDMMVNLQNIVGDYLPENLKNKYLNLAFQSEDLVSEKPFKQEIGRDYAHPGPNCHYDFATRAFAKLKPDLIKLYEQSNQHQGPKSE